RAHFATVALPLDAGPDRVTTFVVSTRRGKQFNSMVQRDVDPLTGAGRDAVFICQTDLDRLGLTPGARVRLTSLNGGFTGRLTVATMTQGNLAVHWPEGNVLLSATAVDPESQEPDYNAIVTLTPEEPAGMVGHIRDSGRQPG
ncbi:MAG: molybdopterin dinucleotide binding domain-containing protein, partial [Vicinamibacterales bacterium]